MKPQAFFRIPHPSGDGRRLTNHFPESLAESVALLLPRHRFAAIVLPQGQVATDCSPELFLSAEELRRYESFGLPKRRREFLGGRICAKLALQAWYPQDMYPTQLVEIATDPSGRPLILPKGTRIADQPFLSITHGGDLVGAVAADHPCGIDLQPIRDNLLRVREKYCRPEEQEILDASLPELGLEQRLALLWTAKEAVKKTLSHRRMYGFLELRLILLRPLSGGCYTLQIEEPESGNATCRVVAANFAEHGMALAFSSEESPHA